MKIIKADISHLEKIMDMYESCVSGMILNNIDQWDATYPNIQIIKNDISNQSYYIFLFKTEIIGGINIDQIQDSSYENIKWEDKTDSFLVVHRLAVKQEYWNKGIGKKLMIYAEEKAIAENLKSIRLDTYSGNPKALEFYRRIGYSELGTIDLKPNKNKYHCFEKLLT